MKRLLFFLLLLAYYQPGHSATVSGCVFDESGDPVVGAAIVEIGGNGRGASTTLDGCFKLNVSGEITPKLSVNFLGYKPQEVDSASDLSRITLVEDAQKIDEVVIVGNCAPNPSKYITQQAYDPDSETCYPTECDTTAGYKLSGSGVNATCVNQVGLPCAPSDKNATGGEYILNNSKLICIPSKCKQYWRVESEKTANAKCVMDIDGDCTDAKNAKSGKIINSGNNAICIPTKCTSERFKLIKENTPNAECQDQVLQSCTPDDENAKSGIYIYRNNTLICEIGECKRGYERNAQFTQCIQVLKKCTDEQNEKIKALGGVRKTGIKEGTNNTCIAIECECGYELDKENGLCNELPLLDLDELPKNSSEIIYNEKCSALPDNAKTGYLGCKNDRDFCYVTECNDDYKPSDNKKSCVSTRGDECDATKIDENAKSGKQKKVNDKMTCVITDCNDGWTPNKAGTKCLQECECGFDRNEESGKCEPWPENHECTSDTKPSLPNGASKALMKCNDQKKAYCEISECQDGKKPQDNKCVSTRGDECDATEIDENATSGVQKKVKGTMTCVITACGKGFHPDKDGTKCIAAELSEAESQAKVDELKENAQAMKDKEQSTENKLLGAAGIGATGIGAMQLMSGMAEQNADADAEAAMKAYLETFHCNYGGGMNIKGGEKNIELPGGNELIGLYSEYVNLANDLKVRKTALDMRPGIEAESILDSATSGLYDDVSLGKTSGAYTSLARALMDPNGADAAAWAEQKDASSKKVKTGAITAGIGAVGSLVGNLAINSGKDKQDKSDEILAKYKKQKESQDGVSDETIIECIDEIVEITEMKYDIQSSNYIISIKCTNPHTKLTQEQALGISKNWNYSDIKIYTNADNVIQEYEKDACETLEKLNTYIKDKNLCPSNS